jgi:NAD(P)-dependent dehydrogenase (short-subunit alcohol dehydrogenase family)
MKLEAGQVAVVTGGASGLGLAMAHEFAARGLSIVLGVPTDVRFPDQVDALAAATIERFGRVDVICNNAGVATMSGATWEVPLEDWKWILDVNLLGVVHGVRSFVPHLVAQNSGHVVNTASMAGVSAGPGMAPYLASKHAVFALTEGLTAELAESAPGVRVTVVCPGSLDTNIATAERNRPAELNREGPEFDPTSLGGSFMDWINSITQPGLMSPGDAGAIVVADVESDVARSFPNGPRVGSSRWIDSVVADLPVT